MHRYNIAIIDDDEDDFLIVKSLLEDISQGPLNLDWAASFAEGEALLAQNTHAICLMDYQLGARDGIELLRAAPSLGFTGPIILLTGIHQSEVDMLALEAGAVDYLVKDHLTAEQLARSIRYALGRREIEHERIERLRAEAENRSKSEFLAHLSHELRTPLSAILGFTELLLTSNQSTENQSHLNVVHRNGKHLLGLLNDILDLSKIEAGKLELEIQTVHFIPFIADLYSLMKSAATDKNLELNIHCNHPLPETIQTDPTRLRQVLINLIGNAIKFTHEGSVDVHISVDQDHCSNYIHFSVQDSGVGISTKYLQAIFNPFVQVKHARAETRTGSGLGLTISRQLVEHLGGTLQVSSVENKGSCFDFSVSAGDLSSVEFFDFTLDLDTSTIEQDALPQFDGKILIVDDLRDIRALIGHYVRRCGPQVDYASNGLDAIHKLELAAKQTKPYDLVLMDIHMPIKDGISATQEIRAKGFECPIIALTAAHMRGDAEVYRNAGFNTSLSKPVEQMNIVNLLSQFTPPQDPSHGARNPPLTSSDYQPPVDSPPPILVVEDSPDVLNALDNIFTLLGWQAIPADTGSKALRLSDKHRPKFALVDINLPDMDGYDLIDRLQELSGDIQVIITSGAELDATRANACVKGHLLKPVSIDQLRHLLNSLQPPQ